ncbi:hypothetical protein Tco_0024702 [Tanacetum coccineum]
MLSSLIIFSQISWASRFRRYLNRKRDNRKWLLKALDEGPYVFKNFIPKGSTIPRLQTAEDLEGDDLLLHDAEMELMNMILLSIPNEIYNSVDACTSAKDMWKRVERLMRGTIQNKVDRETRFTNEFDQFVAEPGEALVFCLATDYVPTIQNILQFSEMFATCKSHYSNFSNPTNNRLRLHQHKIKQHSSGKGHYARNCLKPRVHDSKYFMEQMLLAKQDEAGVIRTDEQNDFLFADASRMEEIEEPCKHMLNGHNSTS